ncbi:MAG: CDP-alcohol phosphatidyltransferase family protein, partial [Pyrinomonadaceae bacterium]
SLNILTIPNLFTLLRLALIPIFACLLYYGYNVLALVVFLMAGISDGIDGLIARKYNQQSELGTVLDPIADKLLMTVSFIVLSMPSFLQPVEHLPVPFWVAAAVIGRDILILAVATSIFIITGFRKFRPSILGKISTAVQVTAVSLILFANVSGHSFYLPTIYFLVVLLALASGIHYIFHVAKLMKQEETAK